MQEKFMLGKSKTNSSLKIAGQTLSKQPIHNFAFKPYFKIPFKNNEGLDSSYENHGSSKFPSAPKINERSKSLKPLDFGSKVHDNHLPSGSMSRESSLNTF